VSEGLGFHKQMRDVSLRLWCMVGHIFLCVSASSLLDVVDDASQVGYWAVSREYGFLPKLKQTPFSNSISRDYPVLFERDFSLTFQDRRWFLDYVSTVLRVPEDIELQSLTEPQLEDVFHGSAFIAAMFIRNFHLQFPSEPIIKLPKAIARPLFLAAKKFDRVPALGYASSVLDNCEPLSRSSSAGSSWVPRWRASRTVSSTQSENGFYGAHCEVEQVLAKSVYAALQFLSCVESRGCEAEFALKYLHDMSDGIRDGIATIKRIQRYVSSSDFFLVARPYLKYKPRNVSVIYEQADHNCKDVLFKDVPGPTGAMTSTIPFLDAVVGVSVSDPKLAALLNGFRDFFPRNHRHLIEHADRSFSHHVLPFIQSHWELRFAFDDVITALAEWRAAHIILTEDYIMKHMPKEAIGTGNTPFHRYLCHHFFENLRVRLNSSSTAVAIPPLCIQELRDSSSRHDSSILSVTWESLARMSRVFFVQVGLVR